MIYNKLLQSKMVLHEDTLSDLANALKIRRETMSNKIRGKTIWNNEEISIIKNRYNLTAAEVEEIFLVKVEG